MNQVKHVSRDDVSSEPCGVSSVLTTPISPYPRNHTDIWHTDDISREMA